MNVSAGSLLGAGIGLLAGAAAGGVYGRMVRGRNALVIWSGAVALLFAGMAAGYLGYVRGLDWLAGLGPGLAAGGMTGVKYGSARLAAWRGEVPPEH